MSSHLIHSEADDNEFLKAIAITLGTFILIGMAIFALGALSVRADTWNGWTQNATICTNTTVNATEANYVIRLRDNTTVPYIVWQTGMNANFSDLFFTNLAKTANLSFYIVNYTSSAWASIDVNIPQAITTDNYCFLMWYNNATCSKSYGRMETTYIFADNFTRSDSTTLGDNWTEWNADFGLHRNSIFANNANATYNSYALATGLGNFTNVSVRVLINTTNYPGADNAVGVQIRSNTNLGAAFRAYALIVKNLTGTGYITHINNNVAFGDSESILFAKNVTFWYEIAASGNAVYGKVWPANTTEPANWTVASTFTGSDSGYVGVYGDSTYDVIRAYYQNFTVRRYWNWEPQVNITYGSGESTLPQPYWIAPSSNATAVSVKYQLMNWTDFNTVSSGKLEWCNTTCVNYTATCTGKYCYLNMSQTANLTYVVARGYLTNASGENVTKDIYINFSNLQTPNPCLSGNITTAGTGQNVDIRINGSTLTLDNIWDCVGNTSLLKYDANNWLLNANITVNGSGVLNISNIAWLKINSTSSFIHKIYGSGTLIVSNSKITSWNTITGTFDTGAYAYQAAERSYIFMVHSTNIHRITNSNVSYLGTGCCWTGEQTSGLVFLNTTAYIINNTFIGLRAAIVLMSMGSNFSDNTLHNPIGAGYAALGYPQDVHDVGADCTAIDQTVPLYNSNGTVFINNTCWGVNVDYCIELFGTSHTLIKDNNVSNSLYGIGVQGPTTRNTTVENNLVYSISYGIVPAWGGSNAIIRNNTAYSNTYNVYEISNSGWGTITNLTFINNSFQNSSSSNIYIQDGYTSAWQFHYNKIFGRASGYDLNNGGSSINATYNWWGTNDSATIASHISGSVTYVPYYNCEYGDCPGGGATLPHPYFISPTPGNGTEITVNYQLFNWTDYSTVTSGKLWVNTTDTNYTGSCTGKYCTYNFSYSSNATILFKAYITNASGTNVTNAGWAYFNLQISPYCGDTLCNGYETCSSCEADCGSCGGGAYCGDTICNGAETCISCEGDCGACGDTTPPTVTIYSPANATTYNESLVWLNVSSSENGSMWYSLNGAANISLVSPGVQLCFQETATSSTGCGLSSGYYSTSGAWYDIPNLYDGNWSSYGAASYISYYYATYTKPTNAISANVTYKNGHTTYNITVPNDCWNYYSGSIALMVIVNSFGPVSQIYCQNGSWRDMDSSIYCSAPGCENIYEEGVWWKFSNTTTTNITIISGAGTNTIEVYANDSTGNVGGANVTYIYDTDFLTNCSADSLSTNHTIDFYLRDEDTLSLINGTLDITFNVTDGYGYWKNYSYSFNGSNNYSVCIFPSTATYYTNAIAVYNSTGYSPKTYYLDYATITDDIRNISLYLGSNLTTTLISFTVQDAQSQPLGDVVMSIQRFYPGTGVYETTEVLKTDFQGHASTYMKMYSEWYKFILTRNGVIINTTSPMTITSTSYTFIITFGTFGEFFRYWNKVAHNCTTSTLTNTTICTILDSSGLMDSSNLIVSRWESGGWATICNITASGSSATLPCDLGDTANQAYYYRLRGTFTDTTFLFDSGTLDYRVSAMPNFGDLGVLSALFILVTLSFVGAFRPNVAMVLSGVSLLFSLLMGLIAVSIGSVIAFMLVISIAAYKGRR